MHYKSMFNLTVVTEPLHQEKFWYKGFTLAEILITLGIIGVIAAMTIPTLISNYQKKQLKSQLMKTYSVLKQAIDMEYAQNGVALGYSYNIQPENKLKDALMRNLKVAKDCNNHDCLHYTQVSGNPYKIEQYKIFSKKKNIETSYFDDGQFILQDGTLIMLERDYLNNPDFILISADINGLEKGPNVWGQDLFTFELTDKGLLPSGAEGTHFELEKNPDLCSDTSSNVKNGIACTERALYDKDFWDNLP